MNNRFDYQALVSRWPILDISRFAFPDEGVEKKPQIQRLPKELSQQTIPPPQGNSRRVSSSLQDPPRTQGAPVNRLTRLALDQAAADLGKPRNCDDGFWHRQVDSTASNE
jgi:hypothetical protein